MKARKLIALAAFAAANPVDLRSLEGTTSQTVVRPKAPAMIGRLMAAFRANY